MVDLQFRPIESQTPNFDDYPVAHLTDIDKLLVAADTTLYRGRRSALVISAALYRILRDTRLKLSFLEGRYRFLQSQTYLLAAPKHLAPANTEPRFVTGGRAKYWLRICVNGFDEADLTMMKCDLVDTAMNLARLNDTGFLRHKSAK